MDKKIAAIILAWHAIYVTLNNCIESARVVLDQTDRGTLLPDRVREMRGELLAVQASIPALADMLEEISGAQSWPTKDEAESIVADPILGEPDPEVAAEETPTSEPEAPVTGEGDYDATGATPVDEEAAAEAEAEAAHERRVLGEPEPDLPEAA